MDLDDFAEFWAKRTVILNKYGAEFNHYLHDIQRGYMTIQEYEHEFLEWYDAKKHTLIDCGGKTS